MREQEWRIKRRELELLAARNFTLPRLDAVATYRNNGFGDDLFGGGNIPFSSAFDVATDGDYDEWEFGFQMNVPIGYRRASAGVRQAELNIRRDRQVLDEQRLQILHDLGSSIRRTNETYVMVQVLHSRLVAARDTVAARQAAFEADAVPFSDLLESQRQLADAEVAFHRETVDWARATESVALESGQLLTSHMIYFDEASRCNTTGVNIAKRRRKLARAPELDYRQAR